MLPSLQRGISPLYCDGQALPQVGEGLGSPVACLRRQPSSLKNVKVSGPKGPAVSMATGVKMWCWLRAAYFSCLFCSARAATAPASLVAHGRWEGANVSLCNPYAICKSNLFISRFQVQKWCMHHMQLGACMWQDISKGVHGT